MTPTPPEGHIKGKPQAMVRGFIDDRERGCTVATALMEHPETRWEFQRLKTGDYVLEDLVVERKTLRDFAASILDGRLFHQAERLARCSRSLLILEGCAADLASCGLGRPTLQGALITVTLIYGIPVLRARDGQETARLILYAARQLRRFASGAKRPGRRPRGKRAIQLRLLQGLPRIGPGRATTLLSTFGTVLGTLQASHEDLVAVKGIGPRTAQSIVWAVREHSICYQVPPTSVFSV